MAMTSRERVLCALNLKEPDRVPYCESNIDPVVAAKLLNLEQPKEIADGSYFFRSVEVEKALSRLLHRDNISCRMIPPLFAEKGSGKDGRQFYGKGLIQGDKDLALLELPDPYDDDLYKEAEDYVKNKGEYALACRTRLGIAPTYLSMGFEGFYYAIYDNPKLIDKVLSIYSEWARVVVGRLCTLGFDFIWSADDLAWKKGPMFSPEFFRSMMIPKIKKIVEKITIPWVHHSDGNIIPLLDDLVDLGLNGIHPLEGNALDINYVKKTYGNRICLIGNIDVNLLSAGTPEEVTSAVKQRIMDIGPGGGYMVSSGNSIAAYCLPENVIAMAEAIQRFGKYPIHID